MHSLRYREMLGNRPPPDAYLLCRRTPPAETRGETAVNPFHWFFPPDPPSESTHPHLHTEPRFGGGLGYARCAPGCDCLGFDAGWRSGEALTSSSPCSFCQHAYCDHW